jgi:hypothetical protein
MRATRATSCVLGFLLVLGACSSESKEKVSTYHLGERVTVGHLIYTVFDTQWLTHVGDDPANQRVPQNRFFLVRASIVNGGAREVVAPNPTLEDDKGNSYPELNNGEGIPQWAGYLRQLRPAETIQGNLVFDVPPAHYKLRVLDEDGNRAALVDIPLSFGTDLPEVPLPGSEKKQ